MIRNSLYALSFVLIPTIATAQMVDATECRSYYQDIGNRVERIFETFHNQYSNGRLTYLELNERKTAIHLYISEVFERQLRFAAFYAPEKCSTIYNDALAVINSGDEL